MSTMGVQTEPAVTEPRSRADVVNDFSIVVATSNGSGSQTANVTIIRALFRMGIPVNGKNLFPSNISGLPTWYTIRVSKDGYVARREGTEIVIAFNEKTVVDDLKDLPAGGVCIYPADWKFEHSRTDVTYYGVPVKEFVKASGAEDKFKTYVSNMVYVGAVAALLGIDLAEIKGALNTHFNNKARAVNLNYGVVEMAANWVQANLVKQDPYRVERMNATDGMIMIEGNVASALGSIFGGVGVVAWYPITPASSVAEAINEYLPQLRTDPETGLPTYAVVQAEDEIAAIGMAIGAGWAGARSMTSTSGPGISLMTEYAGLGYFAEVPVVIWDVQRMGPSTGLPTRVSQGDVLSVYFLGHGDVRHVVLLPGSVGECFDFGVEAFDLAERLQTPVFVLSDLDLGMNLWMSPPFQYPEKPMDRGKVLTAEDLQRLGTWGRFIDVDGDGIGYRTLPGTNDWRAAYFTRGTGHNAKATYSERPEDWEENMQRLALKHDTARTLVPPPVIDAVPGASVGIIAYGSADPAVVEARDRLRKLGIETSYLRLRALPLENSLREFIAAHDRVYVVEINFDGQMAQILRMELPEYATRFRSIAKCDGLPLTVRYVTESIRDQEL
jgi:2-oxoglutarate ferredoxin oxidoreductase subunit alpha